MRSWGGLARHVAPTRSPWTTTCRNPPEEVRRLFEHARDGNYDAVYTYYEEKKHAAWRNLGSRFTNWCADKLIDKPPGLYLSSFRCMSRFLVERVTASYEGPSPYVDGLIFQITQNVSGCRSIICAGGGAVEQHTASAAPPVAAMFLNFSVMPLRGATILGLCVWRPGRAGRRHHDHRGDHPTSRRKAGRRADGRRTRAGGRAAAGDRHDRASISAACSWR